MAVLYATQEASIRAFLNADTVAAWGAKKIYSSAPEVENTATNLPLAAIDLADPTIDEEYSSMRHDGVRLEYTITGHFAKPDTGTLHAAKLAKVEALRAFLMVGQFYHDTNREWLGDSLRTDDMEGEAADGDYKVSVRFAVIVLVEV